MRFEPPQRFAVESTAHIAIDEVGFADAQPCREFVVCNAGFVEAFCFLGRKESQQVAGDLAVCGRSRLI